MSTSQQAFSPTVELEMLDQGQIALVTLVDKARSNAMSPEMGDALLSVVERLQTSQNLRVTIIRADGKDFSIGGARQMLAGLAAPSLSFDERRSFMLGFYQRWLSILDIPVPTIAAIQGECIGIAPIFACAADIAIAEDTTKFQITFTNLGFYPGMALSYLLPRAVNRQHSNLMMIAARPFSGRQAAEAGFVARSVAPGRLMEEALALAREIATNEPLTTRALTRALRITREQLQPALEADGRRQAESYGTEAFRERIAVYLPDHYQGA
jgi:enoyl-CoA hydratase/carnithine racemase